MDILRVLPISVAGTVTEEVAALTVKYHPSYRRFQLLLEPTSEEIQSYFSSYKPEIHKREGSFFLNIDLLRYLNQNYFTSVLALCGLEVLDQEGEVYYGQCLAQPSPALAFRNFAYVSAFRPEVSDRGRLVENLTSMVLHELGHSHGLPDHSEDEIKVGDMLCPMTTAHLRRVKQGELTLSDYLALRGKEYCSECSRFMSNE